MFCFYIWPPIIKKTRKKMKLSSLRFFLSPPSLGSCHCSISLLILMNLLLIYRRRCWWWLRLLSSAHQQPITRLVTAKNGMAPSPLPVAWGIWTIRKWVTSWTPSSRHPASVQWAFWISTKTYWLGCPLKLNSSTNYIGSLSQKTRSHRLSRVHLMPPFQAVKILV